MPVYKTICTISDEKKAEMVGTQTRLIEAANHASAMRHAAKDWISIAVCTTEEAVELGAAGVKIEKAGE